MASNLHLNELPPVEIESLDSTPGAGQTTVYIGYVIPSTFNPTLSLCVIERKIITETGSDVAVSSRWAVESVNKHNEALTFNKKWADRATLDYVVLNF